MRTILCNVSELIIFFFFVTASADVASNDRRKDSRNRLLHDRDVQIVVCEIREDTD